LIVGSETGPKVSVIIPTYNRRVLLLEAVESCLRQSHANLEVIIVDDGSPDDTPEYVREMLASSWSTASVRYQRQENAGASSARNHGLRVASGEFVQFLDSDDLLLPTKIARQLAALGDLRAGDEVCCHCYGMSRPRFGFKGENRVIGMEATESSDLMRSFCSAAVHVLQTSAPLWRRDHLLGHSGWREDIGLGDDLEYYARLLVGAGKICFVEEALFVVRDHGGNRLSVGGPTVSSVSSQLRARRSVHESAMRAGLWDEQTQGAFLGAMRTIYANALETGDAALINDLEHWLWELASTPRRRPGFQAMIGTRRLLGRHFLLKTHRVATRLHVI
jgi:glycosyltransferase involved in cell wall biosynthesis